MQLPDLTDSEIQYSVVTFSLRLTLFLHGLLILLVASTVVMQLAATGLAIHLTRFTKGRWAWYALALAMGLMTARRILVFGSLLPPHASNLPLDQESVAFLVSALCMAALWKLRGYLQEHLHYEELVRAQAARTHAEVKLAESERRYRTLFEQAGDYVLVLEPQPDDSLLIIDVNEAALQAHGYQREELIGRPITCIDPFLTPEVVRRRMAEMEKDKAGFLQVQHRRKDGSLFHAEVRTTMIHLDGRPLLLSSERDVTERRIAEAEVRSLHNLLQASQSIAKVGGWEIDLETNALFWTQETYRIHETSPEEYQPTLETAIRFYAPESLAVIQEAVEKAVEEGRPFDLELQLITAKGRRLWVHTTSRLIHEHGRVSKVIGAFQDITETKLAEQALLESKARLQRAEKVAGFGNWELALAEGIIRGSVGAAEIYGLHGCEWPIHEVQALALPEYRAMLDASLTNILERGQPFSVKFRIRRPIDGQVRHIHSLAEYDCNRGFLFGVLHDITGLELAEEERAKLQAQLLQSQKMESLGSLAGGVAHDMNNVLGAILGIASASIQAQPEGSAAYRAFDTISQAATRGGKMVKSLLSFARQTTAEEHKLDLNSLLEEEVNLLERTVLSRVQLHIDFDPDLFPILGDASALTHAIMNLCVNAVDAMPEGGILTLQTRNVDIDWVEVNVEDTGAGMPPEVLEKAMDPFFTTKGVGKGTGLGLSMVYSTVKAHRGQIDIQSEPGRGTCVRMRLPTCDPTSTSEPVLDAVVKPEQGLLKVLIIDDDELIHASVGSMLETIGHTVLTAQSGEEALVKLEAGLEPDLVILDMNMPGLGGSGTLPRLRVLKPALPVLLSTGRADQLALDLVASTPNTTLLSKPFSLSNLEQAIESVAKGKVASL